VADNDGVHYVLHVRVERVQVKPVTSLKSIGGPNTERAIEEVVNVVRKSNDLDSAVDFVKGVLDLTMKETA
jgi:hypothetical protein